MLFVVWLILETIPMKKFLAQTVLTVAFVASSSVVFAASCPETTKDKIATQIANGHAYTKHVQGIGSSSVVKVGTTTVSNEFEKDAVVQNTSGTQKSVKYPNATISSKSSFANLVQGVMASTTNKAISNKRHKYWDGATGTIVITDENSHDCGTAFRPYAGKTYYDNQN
jgi:hypothetical protein